MTKMQRKYWRDRKAAFKRLKLFSRRLTPEVRQMIYLRNHGTRYGELEQEFKLPDNSGWGAFRILENAKRRSAIAVKAARTRKHRSKLGRS